MEQARRDGAQCSVDVRVGRKGAARERSDVTLGAALRSARSVSTEPASASGKAYDRSSVITAAHEPGTRDARTGASRRSRARVSVSLETDGKSCGSANARRLRGVRLERRASAAEAASRPTLEVARTARSAASAAVRCGPGSEPQSRLEQTSTRTLCRRDSRALAISANACSDESAYKSVCVCVTSTQARSTVISDTKNSTNLRNKEHDFEVRRRQNAHHTRTTLRTAPGCVK